MRQAKISKRARPGTAAEDNDMRLPISVMTLLLAAPLLANCAQSLTQASPQAAAVDDEAVCSQAGAPGSNAYAACMKERDLARETQQRRMDRTHQRMVDDMLNRR
jgi:hypothetical protein